MRKTLSELIICERPNYFFHAKMWKYITRNVRETFERRICSTLTDHSSGRDKTCKRKVQFITPLNKFCAKNSSDQKNNRDANCEDNKQSTRRQSSWNDEYYRHTWVGAVGWSTALVLSWNLLQPLCRVQYLYERDRKHPWKNYSAEYGKEHESWKENLKDNGKLNWQCEALHFTDSPRYLDQTNSVWNFSTNVSRSNLPSLNKDVNKAIYSDGSNYSNIWKILTHTVWAHPTYVVPRPVKITNDETDSQETDLVKYGPATAEEALNEATRNFIAVQNSVMGNIDNRIGVELMERGQYHEAVSHFSKAASLRNASAAYNMGICYEMGLGINQDFKKAAKCYRQASEQGHASAMYNLGVFHVHGWGGLPVDCDEAQRLFEKASSLGQREAKKALEMVQVQVFCCIDESDSNCTSSGIVQQALGFVQELGLGLQDDSELQVLQVPQPVEYKEISDLVHESILKYTSMLQK